MIDELDIVLCAGGMDAAFKAQLVTSVGKVAIPSPGTPATIAAAKLERLNMALWLILNSPDYSVQK
jgi:hypothetical protein